MAGTRSSTSHPLIGHSISNMPSCSLASELELLRMIAWHREQPKSQCKSILSFCCESDRQKVALCMQEGGCMEQENPCLLQKVKLPYQMAGITMMGDFSIKERIVKAREEQKAVCKHLNKKTVTATSEREKYLKKIEGTFDIKDANARAIIIADTNREEKDKEEDLAFFDDFLGSNPTRKWRLGKRDKRYDEEVLSSLLTENAKRNRKEMRERRACELKEKEIAQKRMREGHSQDQEEVLYEQQGEGQSQAQDEGQPQAQDEGQSSELEEYQPEEEGRDGRGRKRKHRGRSSCQPITRSNGGGGGDSSDDDDDSVWLKVPKDILGITSPTSVRLGLSLGDHTAIVAAVLAGSGANLNDFTISKSSAFRHRKANMTRVYEGKRETFKQNALDGNWPLTLHYDEKEMEDSIGPQGARNPEKKIRLAVTITSPSFVGEFLLGAPVLEDGRGRTSATASLALLQDLGVQRQVVAQCYDTTASNTSPRVGAAALIEEARGELLFKMNCRHHQIDLFGKNISPVVSGRTSTGPSDPLFSRLD